MRIILDENVPWPIAEWLAGHDLTTVQKEGWSGIGNGKLIGKIDGVFELFITADKNIRYQQKVATRTVAILELPTNRLARLMAIRETIVRAVGEIRPSQYLTLDQG